MRRRGTGSLRTDGYIMHETGGRSVLEHVRVAEKALGKPLPKGAVVHHIDENRTNNDPSNLVICPSRGYHAMLHSRMRALCECGNANWKKCNVCKKYDDPINLRIYGGGNSIHHADCWNRYERERNNVPV